ncbi:MAG: IPT/TIG domain-containing protein [Candidatus Muirbacterium halophilum]|nr:IPT/TIG domain-containing protein [Candidatus Muirbacterium halophilum]
MEYRKIKILSLTLLLTLIFTGCFGGGKSSNINESQNITSTENPEMVKIRNAALKREEILIKIQEKVKSEKQNSIQQNKSPLNPDTVNDDIYFALSTDSVEIYATNSTMIYRFVYIENAMSVFPEKYTGTMTMYFTIVNGEWILTDGNVDFAEITLSSAKGVAKNLITQEEISDAIVYGIAGDEITRTVKTDTQGVFIIPDIIDNNYDIYVKKAGYTTIKLEDISFDVQKEKQLGIILMSPDQNAHFASISGNAYWDTEQTDPAEGATIYITNSDNTQTDIIPAKTDSTGYYEISYIPAGIYKINAKYINNRSISANLTISNSQASNKNNINMTPLILAGNNKPQITETYPQTTDINLEIGTEQIFAIKVTDLDSDEIVYNWSCSNGSLQLTTTSVNSWEATRSGQQWVKVTASDRKGGEVEQTFNINVINTVGIIEYDIVKRETFFADSQNNVMHTDIDGISYDIIVPENTFSGTLSLKATRFDQNIPLDPWFNNSGIEQKGNLGIEIASTSDLNSPIIVKVPASDLNINTTNTIITMRNSGNSEEYYLGFEEKDGYLEIYVMPEFMENIETATPNRAEIMDPNDIKDAYNKGSGSSIGDIRLFQKKFNDRIQLAINESGKNISFEDSGFSGGTGYLGAILGSTIPDLNLIAGDTPVEGEDNILVVHGIFCWTEIMGGDYYRILSNTLNLTIEDYNNKIDSPNQSEFIEFLKTIHQWNTGIPLSNRGYGSLIEWLRHKDSYKLYNEIIKKDVFLKETNGVTCIGNGLKDFNVMKYNYNSLANNHETGINLANQIYAKLSGNDATLTIVCHSMGGLVTRRALAELYENPDTRNGILSRIKKVIFLSTPNRGGKFTNKEQNKKNNLKIPHSYHIKDSYFNPSYPQMTGPIRKFSQAINYYFNNVIKPNLLIMSSASRNPEIIGLGLNSNIEMLPTGMTQLMGNPDNNFLDYIFNEKRKLPVSYYAIIDNDDLLVDEESIDLTGKSGNENEYFSKNCEKFKNYENFSVIKDDFLELRDDLPWLHFSTTMINDQYVIENKTKKYLKELIPNKKPEIKYFSKISDSKLNETPEIDKIKLYYKVIDSDSNTCKVSLKYKFPDDEDFSVALLIEGDIDYIDTSIYEDSANNKIPTLCITWDCIGEIEERLKTLNKKQIILSVKLEVDDEIENDTTFSDILEIPVTLPPFIENYTLSDKVIEKIHKGIKFDINGKNFVTGENFTTKILYKSIDKDFQEMDTKECDININDSKITLKLPEDAVSGSFYLKIVTEDPNFGTYQSNIKELTILSDPHIYIEPYKENYLEISKDELYANFASNSSIIIRGYNLGIPEELPIIECINPDDTTEVIFHRTLTSNSFSFYEREGLFGYTTKILDGKVNSAVFPLYIRVKIGSQYSNIYKYPSDPTIFDCSKLSGTNLVTLIYINDKNYFYSGDTLIIDGVNFGEEPGKIMLFDTTELQITSWTDRKIIFTAPSIQIGQEQYFSVVIKPLQVKNNSQKIYSNIVYPKMSLAKESDLLIVDKIVNNDFAFEFKNLNFNENTPDIFINDTKLNNSYIISKNNFYNNNYHSITVKYPEDIIRDNKFVSIKAVIDNDYSTGIIHHEISPLISDYYAVDENLNIIEGNITEINRTFLIKGCGFSSGNDGTLYHNGVIIRNILHWDNNQILFKLPRESQVFGTVKVQVGNYYNEKQFYESYTCPVPGLNIIKKLIPASPDTPEEELIYVHGQAYETNYAPFSSGDKAIVYGNNLHITISGEQLYINNTNISNYIIRRNYEQIIFEIPGNVSTGNLRMTRGISSSNELFVKINQIPLITEEISWLNSDQNTGKITVSGENFGTDTGSVYFNDIKCDIINSWSDDKIICQSPKNATNQTISGLCYLKVITYSGAETGKDYSFLEYSTPSISNVSSTSENINHNYMANSGDEIEISGTYFGNIAGDVYISDQLLEIISWNSTLIRCRLPENAHSGKINVVTAYTINAISQEILNICPLIDSELNKEYSKNEIVRIYGENFSNNCDSGELIINNTKIIFNNYDNHNYWSDNEIRFYIPEELELGTVEISLIINDFNIELPKFNIVNNMEIEKIYSIRDIPDSKEFINSGDIYSKTIINGDEFGEIPGKVVIGTTEINIFEEWNNKHISFMIPENTISGDLIIIPGYSENMSFNTGTFIVGPEFTSIKSEIDDEPIADNQYYSNQVLKIEGNNLEECDLLIIQNNEKVIWRNKINEDDNNSGYSSIVSDNKHSLSITLPDNLPLGEYPAYFVNKDNILNWKEDFKVFPEIKNVSSKYNNISKNHGIIGEILYISGYNFNNIDTSADFVTINSTETNTNLPIINYTSDTIECMIPEGTRPGKIKVCINQIESNEFDLKINPVILSLSNASGVYNDSIKINGYNFGSQIGTLKIGGNTYSDLYGIIQSWNNTEITFKIPDDIEPGDNTTLQVITSDNIESDLNAYNSPKIKIYPYINEIKTNNIGNYLNLEKDQEFYIFGGNFGQSGLNSKIYLTDFYGENKYYVDILEWGMKTIRCKLPEDLTEINMERIYVVIENNNMLYSGIGVQVKYLSPKIQFISGETEDGLELIKIYGPSNKLFIKRNLNRINTIKNNEELIIVGVNFSDSSEIYLNNTKIENLNYQYKFSYPYDPDKSYSYFYEGEEYTYPLYPSEIHFNIPEYFEAGNYNITVRTNIPESNTYVENTLNNTIFIEPEIEEIKYDTGQSLTYSSGIFLYDSNISNIINITGTGFGTIPKIIKLINNNIQTTLNINGNWNCNNLQIIMPENVTDGELCIQYNGEIIDTDIKIKKIN